jgi:putative peptide modification system cyclase
VTAAVPPGIEAQANSATSVLRTLVLCDMADSTAMVERLGDQRAAEVIREHDRFARALMVQHGAQEIDKTDGFLLMFERPIQAVAFALAYQRDLAALNTQEKTRIAARFGIHVGEVVIWDNAPIDVQRGAKPTEVEGLVKPIAARLMQLALPGQILLSGVAYDIAHRAQGQLGEQLANVHWRTHGRYRFKGVPDPVPVFEVGEQGIAPLKAPPWSSKAHREMPFWRRPLAIGVELVALVLLAALPVFYLTRPAPAIAFANRDWVVVGDLKNLTGEKVFDDSLQTAFRVGLEQSRYVNVVPDLQVRNTLKRMERDPVTKIDRAVGSEIALREGARALVLPTIAEIGGRVRLTAEVVDPNTQTSVYSDSVDGSGEDSVLPSMDDLLRKMRGRLGESLASISETSAPLADVTTKNLDALKAYSLGIQAVTDSKAADAIALFNRAAEIDPDFALAYLYLTNIYYSTGRRAQAHEYVLKATRNLNRLTMREQMLAQGYAAFFEKPDVLRQRWSTFLKLYPDVPDAHQGLALGLWWFDNDLAGAAEHFDAVAHSRRPQRGMSWMFLGDIQVATSKTDEAAKSYATGREIGAPQLYLDPVNLFVAREDLDGAEEALKKEDTRRFPFFDAEKYLMTAAVDVGRGRLASALAAAQSAEQTADQGKLEPSRQRARLARVAILFAMNDAKAKAELKDYVDQELQRLSVSSETWDFSSYTHLSLAAMLALRHGDQATAGRVLKELQPKAEGSGYFSLEQPYRIAACEAGIDKDARAAAACLEALLSERAYYQTRVALLRAYTAAGDDDKALTTAQWLIDHRGLATAEWLGEFCGRVMNLLSGDEALVQAAALERKAGNDAAAQKLLARFTAAWSKPEGEPPLLRRSRELVASGAQGEKR